MVLQFLFESVTDLSVVPSLFLIFQRQRSFEFFMGVFQFVASFLYNVCDSLDIVLFLDKHEWHKLTNVTGLSYGVNVLVYLMCNTSETQDHLLRYLSFALLWICQIKDQFYMENTQYTLLILFTLGIFALAKVLAHRKRIFGLYRFDKLRCMKHLSCLPVNSFIRNGALFGLVAFIFFLVSLDDHADRYRWKHGVAQLLFGGALFNLWQVVKTGGKSSGLPFNL